MAYARTYTIDDSPTGDTIKAAISTKLDGDLTNIFSDLNTHEALTATHGAAGAIVGTTSTQTLSNKTINGATLSGTITGTAATLTAATLTGTITGTGATIVNATLSGTITGTAATLTGCTVSGTVTGGTFAGTTLSGVTTAAGVVNSGTITGGTLNGITLTGTITASTATLVGFYAEPAGIVKMHAGETAPTGYLECNGAAVSRTTYSDLFTAIGTLWGQGNGSTTFNVPDMRGYVPRGWDHGAGNDPDAATRTAPTGGTAGDHVGTIQSAAISSHLHAVSITSGNESATHTHAVTGTTGDNNQNHYHTFTIFTATVGASFEKQAGGLVNYGEGYAQPATSYESNQHTHSFTASVGTESATHTHAVSGNTAATGDATGNDTRPKNRALMFIIKT